jgi:hypothetical protein
VTDAVGPGEDVGEVVVRVRGFGLAVSLAAAMVLAVTPVVTLAGAPIAVSRVITVHAISLDCITHAQVGCVNVAVDITWIEATQSGRMCIDVNDYRTPAPVPSYGCTSLGRGSVRFLRNHVLSVAPQRVVTTAGDDCYRADPEDGCVRRTFTMVAGLTATPSGRGAPAIARRSRVDCAAHARDRSTVYPADVRLDVDGFGYRMPSQEPVGARNSATMAISEVRLSPRC